jgi:hypothetical protein
MLRVLRMRKRTMLVHQVADVAEGLCRVRNVEGAINPALLYI